MLSFFRRGGVAQVLIAGIVFAIIIVFVLEFRAGRGPGASLTQECAVEVRGDCVSRKDFFASYGLIVPQGMPSKRIRAMGLRKHILEGLAQRELLVQEAERLGISISEQEIDDELAKGRAHVSLPAEDAGWLAYSLQLTEDWARLLPVTDPRDKQFDYKLYERMVRNVTNRSPREFKEMQKRELIAARMRDLVKSRVQISEGEAFRRFVREQTKAMIRSVALDRGWFEAFAVDLSPEALAQWSEDNKAQVDEAWKTAEASFKPGCTLVREMFAPFASEATDAEKVETRARLEYAQDLLKQGLPFARVARNYRDGARTAPEVHCLEGTDADPGKQLAEAVERLKPGQVTPILETAGGFHLLSYEGKLAEGEAEARGRQSIARGLATRFQADELAKRFGRELISKLEAGTKMDEAVAELSEAYAKQAAASLKDAKAKAANVDAALKADNRPKVEISAQFNATGLPIPDALPTEAVAAKALALEKPDAVYPELIQTERGFAVMQLKEKETATREQFDKDRASIVRGMREAKQRDAVARFVGELRKAAGKEIQLNAALAEEPKGVDEPS